MKLIKYLKSKLSKKKDVYNVRVDAIVGQNTRNGPVNLNKNMHGLYDNGDYVPDWIYDGHYDCGDK